MAYHIAFKKVFNTLNNPHTGHTHHTNRNDSVADHFKRARGINKEESLIFSIAIIHHKPHSGIGGRTPAQAAGIHIVCG